MIWPAKGWGLGIEFIEFIEFIGFIETRDTLEMR